MSIKKCCDNCEFYAIELGNIEYCDKYCCSMKDLYIDYEENSGIDYGEKHNCFHFIPSEEKVRQDERNKIITKLEEIKKIVDDNGKSYIISANLLMIIEMIKEREYEKEN